MNVQLFAEYISTVFIPSVEELRSLEELASREAVLLMDTCSIHANPETLQVLAEHRANVITFPPHTTHIFQAFDLSLFSVFKKRIPNFRFRTMKQPLGSSNIIFTI
jgi:hypothetical protein